MDQRCPKPSQQEPTPDPKLQRCYQARQKMEAFSEAMSQLHAKARRSPTPAKNKRNV